MLIYATPTDLSTWTGTAAPTNATALLRAASLMVADATVTAYYDADTTELPTDAKVLAALNQATVIQAAAWAVMGIDPTLGGVFTSKVAVNKHIGTASITYADAAPATAARVDATVDLVPDAVRVLRAANLLSPRIWQWG